MRCKHTKQTILTTILALTIITFLISNVYAHTITVPTNTYFGFGNGLYINFNTQKTFDTTYRENGMWYFDGYGFQTEDANMTITNFGFTNNMLSYSLTRSSGTSTSLIYLKDKGKPSIITGATSWSYDSSTKILTVHATHSSTTYITVSWGYTSPTVSGQTFYFRSDTHTVNTHTGYVLNTAQSNSYIETSASATGDLTVYWSFKIWKVTSNGKETELTSDYTAILTRTANGEGIQNATWQASAMFLQLGFDALKVTAYVKLGSGEWQTKATWITPRLMFTMLYASTWQFSVWTNRTYADGTTTAAFRFGSATYNSLIDGVNLKEPNSYELMLYQMQNGNFIGFITFPWTVMIGNVFYAILLLGVCMTLYIRNRSLVPILVLFIIFGGVGGIFNLMIGELGASLVWFILLMALVGLLYKVAR